ncbi:MAG: hypothetical protein ACK4TS_01110 [Aquabacterium sp.]|jgi:trehalose-6-phosphate synthase
MVDARAYPQLSCAKVSLTTEQVDIFYKKFSKEAFWPTLHTFWEQAVFRYDAGHRRSSSSATSRSKNWWPSTAWPT